MGRVESIEQQVKTLTRRELADFRAWFARFDADAWDRKLEGDAEAGRLDNLAEKALSDHQAGKTREL